MNQSLKQDKVTLTKAEKQARSLEDRNEMMAQVDQEISSLVKLLNEALQSRKQTQTLIQKAEHEKDLLQAKNRELSELELQEHVTTDNKAN